MTTGFLLSTSRLRWSESGFSAGGIGDDFNSKVYNALVAFQNAAGLAADGVAGEQTWNKLLPYLTGYTQITTLPGDTLASVASAYSTTQEAIETANPFISDFNLTPNTTLTVPYGFDVVPENVKYSYFLTVLIVDGLRARYPFMSVSSAGESVMGRDLLYMTIGEGSTEVFANASHHANEWITTPILLKYAEDCLKAVSVGGYIDGEQASRLFEGKKLFVMPLVNPDGVDLVTGALSAQSEFYLAARSIAAEYRSIPFPDGWKANIEGTDLNLNYPAGWQYAKEIKAQQGFTSPAPRDYVGTAPLSALESRAVYNFTISHNFALGAFLSHTGRGNLLEVPGLQPQRRRGNRQRSCPCKRLLLGKYAVFLRICRLQGLVYIVLQPPRLHRRGRNRRKSAAYVGLSVNLSTEPLSDYNGACICVKMILKRGGILPPV